MRHPSLVTSQQTLLFHADLRKEGPESFVNKPNDGIAHQNPRVRHRVRMFTLLNLPKHIPSSYFSLNSKGHVSLPLLLLGTHVFIVTVARIRVIVVRIADLSVVIVHVWCFFRCHLEFHVLRSMPFQRAPYFRHEIVHDARTRWNEHFLVRRLRLIVRYHDSSCKGTGGRRQWTLTRWIS